jgi:hypothetical protein
MVSAAPRVEDRTVYPVEEKVGEELLHRWIVELLRPLIERWLKANGQTCLVGADQFIYYEQFNAHRRVSPDIYVLPGVAPATQVPSWKVWETGIVPSFALEVASQDWHKDYYLAPEAHGEMGTEELLIFDPHYTKRREGRRWQRLAKAEDGRFGLVEHTDGDRIRSETLGCLLRAVGIDQELRLRLALAPTGEELFPTAEEAEQRAREAEQRAREEERQAKEVALARVAELEALLKQRSPRGNF